MTLQTSGPISSQDIETEFGGSAPTSISEYYRGGVNVPNTTANNSIPTSGTISFSDFYGGSAAAAVSVSVANITFTVNSTGSSRSGTTTFINNGVVGTSVSSGDTLTASPPLPVPNWLVSGNSSDAELRVTISSPNPNVGLSGFTLNTWLDLGTNRVITASSSTAGTQSIGLLIEIRNASTTTLLDSATWTFNLS